MAETELDTTKIPQYITDALCRDLLKSFKDYIRKNPEAAKTLEERGRAIFERVAAQEAEENKTCEV